MDKTVIRPILPEDDPKIAEIIRNNLKRFHLDLPGTAYFDPELDHLSAYYHSEPSSRRAYFVVLDKAGKVVGGAGFAEFEGIERCAELQKLYLDDSVKGRGYGKALMRAVEDNACAAGYQSLYLETHTNLSAALKLYEKLGFQPIEKPCPTQHSTMDRFYLKQLGY